MVMIGEIEAEVRCNVPEMDPIAEWAVANEVVILQHEWLKAEGNGPGESFTYDVVELGQTPPQIADRGRPPGRKLGASAFATCAARRTSMPGWRDSILVRGSSRWRCASWARKG